MVSTKLRGRRLSLHIVDLGPKWHSMDCLQELFLSNRTISNNIILLSLFIRHQWHSKDTYRMVSVSGLHKAHENIAAYLVHSPDLKRFTVYTLSVWRRH